MARKRTSETESVMPISGAAPAREKKKLTHAKRSATPGGIETLAEPVPETENAVYTESGTTNSSETYLAIDREEIARLAYSYWEARGQQGGSPEDDWLRAEHELRNLHAMIASA